MGKKQLPTCYVPENSKRHTHFRNRMKGLLNKCHELSVICGVEMHLTVIDEEGNPFSYQNNNKGSSQSDSIMANACEKLSVYDPTAKKFLDQRTAERAAKGKKITGRVKKIRKKDKKIRGDRAQKGGGRKKHPNFVHAPSLDTQQAGEGNEDHWPELFNCGLEFPSSGIDISQLEFNDDFLSEMEVNDYSLSSVGIYTTNGCQDNNAGACTSIPQGIMIGAVASGGTPIVQPSSDQDGSNCSSSGMHITGGGTSIVQTSVDQDGLDYSSSGVDITDDDLDLIFLSGILKGMDSVPQDIMIGAVAGGGTPIVQPSADQDGSDCSSSAAQITGGGTPIVHPSVDQDGLDCSFSVVHITDDDFDRIFLSDMDYIEGCASSLLPFIPVEDTAGALRPPMIEEYYMQQSQIVYQEQEVGGNYQEYYMQKWLPGG